jgi:hypothetical protein
MASGYLEFGYPEFVTGATLRSKGEAEERDFNFY